MNTSRARRTHRAVAQPRRQQGRLETDNDDNNNDETLSNSNHGANSEYAPPSLFQTPPQLQLAVPLNSNYYSNSQYDWMASATPDGMQVISPTDTSPSSDIYSPSSSDNFNSTLPLYHFRDSHIGDPNFTNDYRPFTIPEDDGTATDLFNPFAQTNVSYTIPKPAITVDPVQLSGDSTVPPNYSPRHSTPYKQRSAHRKAIEEKSSIKRKNAETRLSNAITSRLGGTFVPGLANQLNHAAELLEQDHKRIRELEEENKTLRSQLHGVPVGKRDSKFLSGF